MMFCGWLQLNEQIQRVVTTRLSTAAGVLNGIQRAASQQPETKTKGLLQPAGLLCELMDLSNKGVEDSLYGKIYLKTDQTFIV